MQPIKNISDINTNCKEGRYLLAALAILTHQPKLTLFGEKRRGTRMTPFEMMEKIYKLEERMYGDAMDIPDEVEKKLTFEEELERLINRHSKENGSDTPDFILAKLLTEYLKVFNKITKLRDQWYTRKYSQKII